MREWKLIEKHVWIRLRQILTLIAIPLMKLETKLVNISHPSNPRELTLLRNRSEVSRDTSFVSALLPESTLGGTVGGHKIKTHKTNRVTEGNNKVCHTEDPAQGCKTTEQCMHSRKTPLHALVGRMP